MSDAMAAELKRIFGCEELPKECEQWHGQKWQSQTDARVKESHAVRMCDLSAWMLMLKRAFPEIVYDSTATDEVQFEHALESICRQQHATQSAVLDVESDYAATVKAMSEAIQVLAKEQKQTYASCNTLSNTLAEVVKQRMKLEESRTK